MKIELSRWSWQSNGPWERFGGGWKWKLGIAASSGTIIIDLLYGSIRVDFNQRKEK